MKRLSVSPRFLSLPKALALSVAVSVFPLCFDAVAGDVNWTGGVSNDWNNASNWDGPTAGNNLNINTGNTTNFPVLSSTDTLPHGSDIKVGEFGGTGRFDHTAGSATFGNLVFGWAGGNGTFNLANTAATGGTLTGYGTGSGSETITSALILGSFFGSDGGTELMNVNTTGTLAIANDFFVGRGNGTATMNLDAGTITVGGALRVGVNYSSSNNNIATAATGVMNLGGGSVTTSQAVIGDTGGTGTINLLGGTLTTGNVNSGDGSGSSTFNFNGGTLRASTSTTTFMTGLTTAQVRNGGALIDTNGNDITIGQALLHSGISGDSATDGGLTKNGTGTLTIINTANTFTGAVTVNAGTLYANPGNGPTGVFNNAASIIVSNGATLESGANGLFGYGGSSILAPITVNSGGTLTADSGVDVGVGVVTLAGGTLTNGGAAAFGSFRFDRNTSQLVATANSTVSAVNVRFANGASIDVSAGATLNFTGTITDSNLGPSALIKSGGSGTLTLAGTNTYTGTTTLNAGTTLVNGSIGTGAVTVNNSGTLLGGTGTINGAVTVTADAVLQGGAGLPTGALTLANTLTLNSGSILDVVLGTGPAHSTIAYSQGGFNGFNSNQAWTLGNIQAGTYTGIFTGVASGIDTSGWTVTNGSGYAYTFTDNMNTSSIDLAVTAVPEPSTVFGGLMLAGVVAYRGRRRLISLVRSA